MINSGIYSVYKIFVEINDSILKFLKARFKIEGGGRRWPEIVSLLERLRPTVSIKIVRWKAPFPKWIG